MKGEIFHFIRGLFAYNKWLISLNGLTSLTVIRIQLVNPWSREQCTRRKCRQFYGIKPSEFSRFPTLQFNS